MEAAAVACQQRRPGESAEEEVVKPAEAAKLNAAIAANLKELGYGG